MSSSSDEEDPSQRLNSLFNVEEVPDVDDSNEAFRNEHQICVVLKKGSDGFGLHIDGGKDRPLHTKDSGIFITRINPDSAAEKKGCFDIGDKIIEVNGHPLVNVNHSEAVNYFKFSEGVVRLVIHKHIGLLLEAAASSEENLQEMDSPTANPKDLKGFSPIGFVFGIAIGCIAVLAARRYFLQR